MRAFEESLLALAGDASAPEPARLAALRPFESIGGPDAVQPLARLLEDSSPAVREAARVALETNPSTEASGPLREALKNSKDKLWTMGLIDSLMQRRDELSVPVIRGLLGSDDSAVVRLAAQALGTLGRAEAVAALREAQPRLTGMARPVAQSALIRAGAPPEAVEALWPDASNAAVRCEIFMALLATGEAAAGRIVAAVLAAPDLPGAAQILRETVRSGGQNLAETAIRSEPKLPLPARLALLGALADAKDTRAAATVTALLETVDARYRTALLSMLGPSGTEAQVPVLLAMTGDRAPEVAGAAAVALSLMRLDSVDSQLLARAGAGSEEDRIDAIRLAAYRNPPGTEDVLGKLLENDPSPAVREAAMESLGAVGGMATANLFLTRIALADDPVAARPLQAEFRRMVPRLLSVPVIWSDGFMPAYEAAKGSENRVALLIMVASLRGTDAGKFLVKLLREPSGAEKAGALKQLTAWTHTDAGPFMLESAQDPAVDLETRNALFNALTRLFFPTAGGTRILKRRLAEKVLAAAPNEETRKKIQQAIEDSKVLEKNEN